MSRRGSATSRRPMPSTPFRPSHYAVQSEISRLEQAIAHAREIRERQQGDLGQAQRTGWPCCSLRYPETRRSLNELERHSGAAGADHCRCRAKPRPSAVEALRLAEESLEQWQNNWHEFNLGVKELQQTAAGRTDPGRASGGAIEPVAPAAGRPGERSPRHRARRTWTRRLTAPGRHRAGLGDPSYGASGQTECTRRRRLMQLRQQERQLGADLEQVTAELGSRQGQLSALQAMQQAALGSDDADALRLAFAGTDCTTSHVSRSNCAWRIAGYLLSKRCLATFCRRSASRASPTTCPTCRRRNSRWWSVALWNSWSIPRTLLSHVGEPGHAAHLLATVLTAESLADAVKLQGQTCRHINP